MKIRPKNGKARLRTGSCARLRGGDRRFLEQVRPGWNEIWRIPRQGRGPTIRRVDNCEGSQYGLSLECIVLKEMTSMSKLLRAVALAGLLSLPSAAFAQVTKVGLGLSGWTGFAPLTLARRPGSSRRTVSMSLEEDPAEGPPSRDRLGRHQCAATTVETWIVWNANGVATKQIFQLDKSYGADGMAVRNDVAAIKDLKGRRSRLRRPAPRPIHARLVPEEERSQREGRDGGEPGAAAAAQAFVAGQNDAAMTYEPYLSTVRAAPDKGKIIATTLDYPMIMDTVGCTPKFLADNPKARKLWPTATSSVEMISKEQAKAYEIMGADVKQSGEQFGHSAKFLRWQDKAANQKFFAGELQAFSKEAAELLLEIGIIKQIPGHQQHRRR